MAETSIGEITATIKLRDQLSAEIQKSTVHVEAFGRTVTDAAGRVRDASGKFVKTKQDVDGLGTSFEKTGDKIGGAGTSAKRASLDFDKMGQSVQQAGQNLLIISAAVSAVGLGAAKAAIDFESSFAGIRKTVDGVVSATGELTDFGRELQQQFRDMAKEIPINVNELNKLGEAAGALGIPKEEIADFAKVMALLGETTDVTADMAAESIAKIQNIFGKAGKDTDRFGAALVALGNDGASTESQILSMATRIAGAGNTIGLSQGQVLAFASALSSVGLEAEAGGSAISRVFVDISSAVSKGGQELANFANVAGQPVQEFARLFREDAASAVNEFILGLGRIKDSGGDLIGTLSAMGIEEVRMRDTLLRAAGAGNLLTDALKLQGQAWQDNSALTREANERFKTTAAQLELLWNRVKDVGITIGNAMLPAIQSAVQWFGKLLPFVDAVGKAFAALPGPVQLAVIGLGAMLALSGPLLIGLGSVVRAVGTLVTAYRALAAAEGVQSATRALGGFSNLLPGLATRLSTVAVELGKIPGPIGAMGRGFASLIPSGFAGGLGAIAIGITGIGAAAAYTYYETKRLKDEQASLLQQAKENKALLDAFGKVSGLANSGIDVSRLDENQRRELLRLAKDIPLSPLTISLDTARAGEKPQPKPVASILGDTGATNALADAFTKLKDAQADAIIQAKAWAQFAGTDLSKLPLKVQEEYYHALQNVVDTFGSLQAAGLGSLGAIYNALDLNVGKTRDLNTEFNKLVTTGTAALTNLGAPVDILRDTFRTPTVAPLDLRTRAPLPNVQTGAAGFNFGQGSTVLSGLNAAPQKGFADALFGMTGETFGKGLSQTLLSAIAGGGDIGKSAGGFVGQSLGTNIAKKSGEFLTKTLGKTLGGAIGSIIPGLGTILGSFGGQLLSKLANSFRKGAIANDLRDAIKEKLGGDVAGVGLDAIVSKFTNNKTVMAAYQRFLTAGSDEAVQTAADALTRAIKTQEQALAEHTAKLSGKFGELQKAVGEFGGYVPKALQPAVQELLAMAGIPDDMREALEQLTQTPLAALEQAAGRLGVNFHNMGAEFKQAIISKDALQMVRDLDLIAEAGGNMDGVLKDAAGKIAALVDTAKGTGAALPETLKPYIQRLIDLELLTDPNGDLVRNIEGLSFADIEDTTLNDIKSVLEEIRDLLRNGIPDAARIAQDSLDNISVPDVSGIDIPSAGGGGNNGYLPDGSIDPNGPYGYQLDVPQMAEGGVVRPRAGGTLVNVGEAGSAEAIVPLDNYDWMGGGGTVVHNHFDFSGAFLPDRESLRELAYMITAPLPDSVRFNRIDR